MNLCVIPARGGSKRIPRKNLYPFEGIPMVAHAIRIARSAGCFDEVLVSTDCPEIAAVARHFGANVPFMRTKATSNDHATTFEVISEVLDQLKAMGQAWDIGVCLYPTAVLSKPEDIAKAVEGIKLGEADSFIPIAQFDYPIWRSILLAADCTPIFAFPEHANTRSQDLAPAYHDAGQWYAFDISVLRATGNFMGPRARVVVLQSEHVQDIDTLNDLRMAELKSRARRESSVCDHTRECTWVLIRVDATPKTGSGHLMRCLALADAFAARGQDVVFVSRTCVPALRRTIEKRGFESRLLEDQLPNRVQVSEELTDAAATLSLINRQSMQPAWVVVDHYGLDAAWEAAVRSCGVPILALDDHAGRLHACDVLLDQNMIADNHALYHKLVPEGCQLLLGGAYSLLRKEFAQALAHREEVLSQKSASDVVLFMGATDAANVTLRLAMELTTYFGAEKVVVLVGHLNANQKPIKNWCQEEGVRCHVGLEDISSVFVTCRLFVGACGMTAVEAQALGIPSLLLSLSPIQQAVADWFASKQRAVLFDLKDSHDSEVFREHLTLALSLPLNISSAWPISVHGAKHAVDFLMEVSS